MRRLRLLAYLLRYFGVRLGGPSRVVRGRTAHGRARAPRAVPERSPARRGCGGSPAAASIRRRPMRRSAAPRRRDSSPASINPEACRALFVNWDGGGTPVAAQVDTDQGGPLHLFRPHDGAGRLSARLASQPVHRRQPPRTTCTGAGSTSVRSATSRSSGNRAASRGCIRSSVTTGAAGRGRRGAVLAVARGLEPREPSGRGCQLAVRAGDRDPRDGVRLCAGRVPRGPRDDARPRRSWPAV